MSGSTPEMHSSSSEAESRPYTDSADPPIVDPDKLQQREPQKNELDNETFAAIPDGPTPQVTALDSTLNANPELYGDDFIPPHKLRRRARQQRQDEAQQHLTIHPETVRLVTEVASNPKLRQYVRNRVGSGSRTATVEDIAQEVILAVLKKFAKAPPAEDGIWPFVFGVAAHKVADYYRADYAGRKKEEPVGDIPDIATTRSAADVFWEKWDRQRVRAVMAELATTDAQKARLQILLNSEDLTSKERGEILGTSADSTRVSEHRFRAKARKGLERRFGGEEIAFGYFVAPTQEAPRESSNRKRRSTPKPSISEVRYATAEALHAACSEEIAHGGLELSTHIPLYLGAWTTALLVLDRLRDADVPRPSAIIFPHERLLPAFRTFVEGRLGQTASYLIQTPDAIADWLGGRSLEHVVVPDGVDESLKERLRAHSSFILWLLDKIPSETAADNTFCAPSYRSVGGRSSLWGQDDSVLYLQEWRFATGDEMTQMIARRLGKQGGSPTLLRLIKDADYDKLAAEAGYPPTPKAE